MRNLRLFNRRKFVWLVGLGSLSTVVSGFGERSIALPRAEIVNPNAVRLHGDAQLLLREINSTGARDATVLSRFKKFTAVQVEESFTKLNDAFSFDQISGKLTRNPAIKLDVQEERTVQQLLDGYEKQLQAGEITLRRSSKRLFIPLTSEPETERSGVVPTLVRDQIKSFNKVISLDSNNSSDLLDPDRSLIAAGCGWRWWKSTRWWGIRLTLNKGAVNWLTSGATTVSAILAAMGLGGLVASAIIALAGILKRFSNAYGIRIYIPWIAIPWVTGNPDPSGSC